MKALLRKLAGSMLWARRSRPGGAAGRPAALDRWTVRAVLALLAAWSTCLWVLSGRAFGACWAGMVELAAVELAMVAVAMNLAGPAWKALCLLGRLGSRLAGPGRRGADPGLGRCVRRALQVRRLLAAAAVVGLPEGWLRRRAVWRRGWPSRRAARRLEVKLTQRRRAELALERDRRLLAAACLAAAFGGLAAMALIAWASAAMAGLGGMFLLPAWAWAAVRTAVAAVVMAPLAAGAGAVVLAACRLRRYGSSDPSRYVHLDLALSSSAALAGVAALWWGGLNLHGAAWVCAVAVVGLSLATASRRPGRATRLPRPAAPQATQRSEAMRARHLAAWAALAWLVVLQCRLLRDAAGADWASTWLWAAATGAVLAAMGARLDRRVQLGPAREASAAGIGAVLVAAGQLAMLTLALRGRAAGWAWVAAAAAGQAAFAALWSVVLARARRLLARRDPAAWHWPADAALGLAIGAALAIAMLSSPAPGAIVGVSFLALAAATIALGMGSAGEKGSSPAAGANRTRRRRVAVGAASILAVGLLLFGLGRSARRLAGGALAIGPSLTVAQVPGGAAALPLRDAGPGSLCRWAAEMIHSRPGRWWIVSPMPLDPPLPPARGRRAAKQPAGGSRPATGEAQQPPPEGPILLRWGLPDPAFGRLPGFSLRAGQRDPMGFPRSLALRPGGFDGIYLSGLPVEHPDAWCLYHRELFERCLGQLSPGGLLMVRVRGGGGLEGLIPVAESFRRAAGGGFAAAATTADAAELLLVAGPGPARDDDPPEDLVRAAGEGLRVFSLHRLACQAVHVDPITISTPRPRGHARAELIQALLAR